MSSEAINSDFIDVRKLMKEVSVEELCRTAEEFFAQRVNWDSLNIIRSFSWNSSPRCWKDTRQREAMSYLTTFLRRDTRLRYFNLLTAISQKHRPLRKS